MRPGSANTSVASRAVSLAVRTPGNASVNRASPEGFGIEAHFRTDGLQQLAGPSPQPPGRRVGRHQGLRIGLEKADVRARRRDRDLDRQDALPRQAAHDVADERRLAVAARRDQEDLLARGQVGAQALPLALTVGERLAGDDLAVDEGIAGIHYADYT